MDWKKDSGEKFRSEIFPSKAVAEAFADSLQKNLTRQGFLLPGREEKIHADTVVIQIDPGELHVWKEVKQGNIPEEWWENPGSKFDEPYQWMEMLIKKCEDSGFPFASVSLAIEKIEDSGLYGIFRFQEGPKILWDSLEVSGETKTRLNFLQLYSGISPGKAFSQTQFEEAMVKMQRSPYFLLDSIPRLSFQIKRAKAHFRLVDRKINVFDGIIGLAPGQTSGNSMLLTGELNLALFHLGGKGRDISVHWQRPNIQSQQLELSAKESYLFGSLLDFGVNFSLFKQDSSFINRNFKLEFNYPVAERGYLRFFGRRQAGDLFSIADPRDSPPDLVDFRWNNYGLGFSLDRLDNPFFPRKGWKAEGEFAIGNKRLLPNTALSADFYEEFKKSTTQIQGSLRVEKHQFVNTFWGMWFRLTSGFLRNENLFLNELSRLGGLKSIRGFNEMFFFADRYAYVNFEQRLYLGKESFLLAFGDVGLLNNPFLAPQSDLPRSFGLGINLDTDGGLFSFVVGLGKSNLQPISLSSARIHFGYSARF